MLSSAGQNCLPSDGIGAVSDQLAARLPTSSIRLNTAAAGVTSSSSGSGVTVSLADGNSIAARAVVVAVEQQQNLAAAMAALFRLLPACPPVWLGNFFHAATLCCIWHAPYVH